MNRRTPLAWKNLTHDSRRLTVAVTGVGFAALLIFMELGFLNALLESTVQVLRKLNGELIIISPAKYTLPAAERFDIRRLQQAQGLPGIQAVFPVYMESSAGVLRARNARAYPIRVLAFREDDPVFNHQPLALFAAELLRPGAALADLASRVKYGIPRKKQQLSKYEAELSSRRIHLVGHFHLGVDFATEGNLLMTATNFATFFPNRAPGRDPLSLVDLGVVKLAPGANPQTVLESLRTSLPNDVEVLTREQLIDREMTFWRTSAPVGYIFLVGVYMGFVVGVIICYQIIYTDISDHMREFATLKAMGYSTTFFLQLVMRQALYLSLMGFVPGAVLSYSCYMLLSIVTGLTMEFTIALALTVFSVTLLMCVVSGLMALRKLLALDPAELF